MKKEYKVEESPFYFTPRKLRQNLEVIENREETDLVLARKRYFKQDEYTKLIINDTFDINQYDKLSGLAKTLLFYILYNCLEYNTPVFRLKMQEFYTILKRDKSFAYKARKELILNNIIHPTSTKELYWINHNRFYKGNFIVDKYYKEK